MPKKVVEYPTLEDEISAYNKRHKTKESSGWIQPVLPDNDSDVLDFEKRYKGIAPCDNPTQPDH